MECARRLSDAASDAAEILWRGIEIGGDNVYGDSLDNFWAFVEQFFIPLQGGLELPREDGSFQLDTFLLRGDTSPVCQL